MIYIGIDPGLSGAICFLSRSTIVFYDAPVVQTGKGREYDLDAVMRLLPAQEGILTHWAGIELVHAMPQNGSLGNFKLGYSMGLWTVACTAKGIPHEFVLPSKWKKEFGLIGKNKDGSRLRALQLFPQVKEELKRKKDDGRAEALLIAEWVRRLSGRRAGTS